MIFILKILKNIRSLTRERTIKLSIRIPNLKKRKFTKDISPLLNKLLKNGNIHNIVLDNMNLNDNFELFDNYEIKESQQLKNNYKSFELINNSDEINNDLQTLSKNKFKDLNKELMSLYRLHSSKFHSRKIEKEKNISDRFTEEMNSLIDKEKNKEKINLWNEPIFKRIQNNKNILEFRKKMAFRFRYINYSPKKFNKQQSFKLQDDKMNKILKISKSIPNFLLRGDKQAKNANKIIFNGFNNNMEENYNIKEINREENNKGIFTSFKLNRYLGNIYNYYRSDICLNENNLIFKDKKEDINNYEDNFNKMNDNNGNNSVSSIINYKNRDINKRKSKKTNRTIKLSSLL